MTPLPSPASLLARQVRLHITPPTSTLFESRAVLSEVRSNFGPISIFISPRNDPALRTIQRSPGASQSTSSSSSSSPPFAQRILAVFDLPSSKSRALASGRITVACGGDLVPSARELDPFNVRGLHGRYHPPKRNFDCEIVDEDDADILEKLALRNPYTEPYLSDTLEMSYVDLIGSGIPSREMADVMRMLKTPTHAREESVQTRGEETVNLKGSASGVGETGSLMAAWRRLHRPKDGKLEAEVAGS